ncbi:MAG: TRAP transporter large permease [Chloroflexi bacterium]|nr:TRAP transporter large permease [Chloroflexota bacterium]
MDSLFVIGVTLVGGLFVLLLAGLEIGWAMGVMAGVGLVLFANQPLYNLAWSAWASFNSYTLTALPLFVFMGSLLGTSGVSSYLFSSVEKWLNRLPGGLPASIFVGNGIFGAMCGSSIAAVSTFGKLAIPDMERRGYDMSLSLGCVAIGGILSPLIPPSLLLIVYGSWAALSIGHLFAAAIIPGIIMTIMWAAFAVIRVVLNPKLAPPLPRATWRERFAATGQILPFGIVIVGTLGVIFGGVMTPTEAAAMGAVLSVLLTLAYRKLTMSILKESLYGAVRTTAMCLMIVSMATVLSRMLNMTGIIPQLKDVVLGLPIGKYGVIALFYLVYLAGGTVFDGWSMLFLTFPVVMPIITELGFDPIWWGVAYVIAAEQCQVTPPYGMNLYVLHSMFPKYSLMTIVRGAIPFLIPMYILLILMTAYPQIALWLPSLIYGR